MKTAKELRWETNSTVYSRMLKLYREHKCEINCSRCPYHKYENWEHFDQRNWKRYRKHQYKE
jgi:hypothetical protein